MLNFSRIFQELCRKAVADGGEDFLLVSEETSLTGTKRRKLTKREKCAASDVPIQKIVCPVTDCGKESKDIRGTN